MLSRLGLLKGKPDKAAASSAGEYKTEMPGGFQETKVVLDQKIQSLESKTEDLDKTLSNTLTMTHENREKLNQIEADLEKLIKASEEILGKLSKENQPPQSPQ